MKHIRGTFITRVVMIVCAILMMAAGAFLLAINVPWWPPNWPALPQNWHLDPVHAALERRWLIAAMALLAILLAIVVIAALTRPFGLLRSYSHTVTRGPGLHVQAEPAAVAKAAAQACVADPDVSKASFTFVQRQRRIVLDGSVTVAASADLALVSTHVDRIAAQARDVLGITNAYGRIRVSVTHETGTRRIS